MIELKDYNGKKYASARDLHKWLEIKKDFTNWFKYNAEKLLLKEDSDFTPILLRSKGGRQSFDYLLIQDAAIDICASSGGKNANNVRKALRQAFKEKQTGILLNADQVAALTDVVKAMTLVSVQQKAEKKHYIALNKPDNWWQYRADLLGYSKQSLIDALSKINVRYQNQKQALIHLDKAEIIRTGVIDLLIALGRDREYALNVAEFAKIIAEKNGYHLQIWDDTKPNPLGLRLPEIIERQSLNPLNK